MNNMVLLLVGMFFQGLAVDMIGRISFLAGMLFPVGTLLIAISLIKLNEAHAKREGK